MRFSGEAFRMSQQLIYIVFAQMTWHEFALVRMGINGSLQEWLVAVVG
jgi:hypothetical protein